MKGFKMNDYQLPYSPAACAPGSSVYEARQAAEAASQAASRASGRLADLYAEQAAYGAIIASAHPRCDGGDPLKTAAAQAGLKTLERYFPQAAAEVRRYEEAHTHAQ